ncbi:MAG: tetratricopeptide repeat protein, partial [Lentisphaerota bacterium]
CFPYCLKIAAAVRSQVAETVIPSTHGESLGRRQAVGSWLDFSITGVLFQAFAGHKAEPFHRRSLAIKEMVFGLEHPSVALTLECLASIYRESKRGEDAEALEKRAASIRAIKR